MWRQVFVICLLITLSDFWSGVQAALEQEFLFEDAINDLTRRYLSKQRRTSDDEHIDAIGSSRHSGGDTDGEKEINAEVKEPGEADKPHAGGSPTGAKTGENTLTNDTGKTTPNTPLGAAHHQASDNTRKPTGIGGKFANTDIVFLVTVAACSVAGLVGIIMAGVCWYKLNRSAKAASDVEYPAYGVTGPNKERIPSPGDRKLAQSAQMYHYQHQKQQMIAMEKANGEMKHDASDEESEEENEEGDYTVYECPGLAPTGEMEVKNPLFSDETPVTPSAGDDKKDGSN